MLAAGYFGTNFYHSNKVVFIFSFSSFLKISNSLRSLSRWGKYTWTVVKMTNKTYLDLLLVIYNGRFFDKLKIHMWTIVFMSDLFFTFPTFLFFGWKPNLIISHHLQTQYIANSSSMHMRQRIHNSEWSCTMC